MPESFLVSSPNLPLTEGVIYENTETVGRADNSTALNSRCTAEFKCNRLTVYPELDSDVNKAFRQSRRHYLVHEGPCVILRDTGHIYDLTELQECPP